MLIIYYIIQAQARKADLRTIPEQVILSEVRRMVEQMQALNRQLVETVSHTLTYLSFIPFDIRMHLNISSNA